MSKGFNISESIHHLLTEANLGCDVFPLINQSEVVNYPYVVYGVNGITPEYTKDGAGADNLSFYVIVCDVDYDRMVEISIKVRTALEMHKYSSESTNIRNCKVDNMEEMYDDGFQCFARRIQFKCTSD